MVRLTDIVKYIYQVHFDFISLDPTSSKLKKKLIQLNENKPSKLKNSEIATLFKHFHTQ